ncbi:2570_t:CDS:2 [Funneliformis geosporum]|nr:2570_t:CDS:2 [Funneliformis geosporum]
MAGISKRKKHIKKLAEKKRNNKHVQVAINVEDNEERNSARTKRRHHAQAKKDAEKNGQTIDHFFLTKKFNENSEISEESEDDHDLIYNSQQTINSLEAQLKEKNLNEVICNSNVYE